MSDRPTVTIIKDDEKPYGLRILTEDGRDISTDLGIRKVTWTMEAGQVPTVTLECLGTRIRLVGHVVTLTDSLGRQLSVPLRTPTI